MARLASQKCNVQQALGLFSFKHSVVSLKKRFYYTVKS